MGLALAVALAAGCVAAITPEQAAEGALRAQVNATVAPNGYRSGLLSADLAEAWRSRVAADLSGWYGENLTRSHLDGNRNVTASMMEQPGPIVMSVEILDVILPPATIEGDTATIREAAITYMTQFAPGTWHEAEKEGVTMCRFDLRRVDGRWLIQDEGCNVSGG